MQGALSLFLADVTAPVYVLFGVIVLIVFRIVQTELRLHRLLRGQDAKTLEDTIQEIEKRQSELEAFRGELEKYLEVAEKRLRHSIQGVTTLRFNPFKEGGGTGNQSFATAFLNEEGDGVVISSLYTRDRTGVFAKPVYAGESEFELSAEERESIKQSRASVKEANR